MREDFYTTPRWREVSSAVIARDSGRCTVARLLGGACDGTLHAHHIERPEDAVNDAELERLAFDMDNLATVCARHHPMWEAIRRMVAKIRERERGWRRCPHAHPTRAGRRACEERLNRGLPELAAS